ncbi:hypothetical protein SAY87_020600 [Trapa incisa]|uniref:O-fucosyltransferase family protein n=1 Tax=Trapa incisa TaxID=236973 RepID=A0AAN7PMS2_9MYRT|nr:hypothetical protein SAY87_020600 [Trapa incisa]
MQKRRRRTLLLLVLRKLLTCAICAIALLALLHGHVFPSYKLPGATEPLKFPSQHEIKYQRVVGEQSWKQELVPPHLSKPPVTSHKLDEPSWSLDSGNLWKPPPNRDFFPCIDHSPNYTGPAESRGYLLVHTNGGLNQMRAGELATARKATRQFRSWSGMEYYQNEIARMWENHEVIRAAKSDSRLANNKLNQDIQKLRCRACYQALRFAPRIEAMGKLLVERMRSYGPYIALHLRYEKDMLAFSGCTHGLSPAQADELRTIRENTEYWKVKEINSTEQRYKGYCPLTPREVGILLTALGYRSNTPIYIAAGDIYGGDFHMADLRFRYPILMNKEKLASVAELQPFLGHASQMAALDYIVSVESDVFIPSYSGNMARAVGGHRRFLGHRKTISPDRKAFVRLVDKLEQGTLSEGRKFSDRIIELHRRRQGSPRKRKGPISGTKGMDRFRSEEAFYENPLPDCLCQGERTSVPLDDRKQTT